MLRIDSWGHWALVAAVLAANVGTAVGDDARGGPADEKRVVILHTNDLHSHLMGFAPEADYSPASSNDDHTRGGMARLAAAIARARREAGDTPALLLDAGDFTMGTPFHLLGTQAAAELMVMQRLGYDAIALGNHEFDWTPTGLAAMLAAASDQGFDVPLLATNLRFDPAAPGDDALAAFEPALIRRQLVKVLPNGVKVGLFGLMGRNAAAVTPMALPVTFRDAVETAREAVADLRTNHDVDVVICVSHSGIDGRGAGEDADLAAQVPGIDVIVSGHTHDALPHPARVGRTLIVQAGSYGRHLGRLTLHVVRSPAGTRVVGNGYELVPIVDGIEGDAAVQAHVDHYIAALDAALAPAGLGYRHTLVESAFDVWDAPFAETPIGDLVTDAYRAVVARLEPTGGAPIAVEYNGLIRADLRAGNTGKQWFADLFRVLPLGIGPDARPGYPLVTFHLAGPDIKSLFELTAASKDVLASNDFFSQVSGVRVEYAPRRPAFDRVSRVTTDAGAAIDLGDASTCHRFTANLYVASLVGLVEAATGGAVAVRAKAPDCRTPVADWLAMIVDADPATPGTQEIKAWQALMGYVSALPDTTGNGIGDVPAGYAEAADRIVRLHKR